MPALHSKKKISFKIVVCSSCYLLDHRSLGQWASKGSTIRLETKKFLFHSYSQSLVLHTFPQPPEQCVRRPELARLSAVPTRGAVEDSHLDVFSNLDSGYRLRFPPLIWTTKDQWISPVCQRAACRWEWGSDSQHQHSHRCQRSTGKPPSPWTNYILFMRPLVEKWSHK